MSRTGKKPVVIPDKVKVNLNGDTLNVEGPLGKLSQRINSYVKIDVQPGKLLVTRIDDSREARACHGLVRALVKNMVEGASTGFTKNLDIEGVGYRAEVKGNTLNLTLGFSHPIEFAIPQGVKITVDKQTKLMITGSDREKIGQIASDIRKFRPPEPYKGKGIRYSDEVIQRKVGKAAATAK